MSPDDLELVSTKQLIDELMRRTTFMGVVVHCKEENRAPWTRGVRTFRVHYNENLDDDEARRLLSAVSEQLDSHEA
jgi:hypothetical protein